MAQSNPPRNTVILVDVSGSMDWPISPQSQMKRYDAANGLAILVRELAEKVEVYSFSENLVQVPARHGFALRDVIAESQAHVGTYLGKAIAGINQLEYDRLIVFTDEQTRDVLPNPLPGALGYMINVSSDQNGVGYGTHWTNITGWSEAIIKFVKSLEAENV